MSTEHTALVLATLVTCALAWLLRLAARRLRELRHALDESERDAAHWKDRTESSVGWKRYSDKCAELGEALKAKKILRRRLRGVLWQARAWKAEAVSRGWTPAEDRAAWQALRAMRAEAKARRRAAAKARGR